MKTVLKCTLGLLLCFGLPAFAKGAKKAKAAARAEKKAQATVALKVVLITDGAPAPAELPLIAQPELPAKKTSRALRVVKNEKRLPRKPASEKPKPVAEPLPSKSPAPPTLAPKVKPAAIAAAKPNVPAGFSPETGSYEKSSINFNGLIDKADRRQSRLVKRVKAKTAEKEDAQKVARYDFVDLDVKWEQEQAAKASTVAAQPRSTAADSDSFTLQLRPKKP